MRQTWDHLLMLHWRVPTDLIRRHVPERLSIDTYDGSAWVGITPFTIRNIRVPGLPSLPVVSDSHEVNVRTYVLYEGVPGILFLSLDANNPLAVVGARLGFSLPYHQAQISLEAEGERVTFESRRTEPGAGDAHFKARWALQEPLPLAEPGTLDFFLAERYCLYTTSGESLVRARIHHQPWPLRSARVDELSSTLIESNQIPTPEGEPVVHAQAEAFDADIWPPETL